MSSGFAWVALDHNCRTPPRPADTGPAAKVTIDNFRFTPAEVTVPPARTVTWVNKDDAPHTATAKGGKPAFDSVNLIPTKPTRSPSKPRAPTGITARFTPT